MEHLAGPYRFRARYTGNGTVMLYCPQCDTREEGVLLYRVHDHATKHDRFWHGAPFLPPGRQTGLTIIDLRKGRVLRGF